jgi:hypothetical protein
MSNLPIRTRQDLIRAILEKDSFMQSHRLTYVQRAYLHAKARIYLLNTHPELRQTIEEAYAESGVCDTRLILSLVKGDKDVSFTKLSIS